MERKKERGSQKLGKKKSQVDKLDGQISKYRWGDRVRMKERKVR